MSKSNGEIIQEKFPTHQFYTTYNEYGYSDIEIIIDGEYSGIWVDDWVWFENNNDDLEYLVKEIKDYLSSIANRDCHKCIFAHSQKSDILNDTRVPILECSRHEYKKSCKFIDKGWIPLKG